MESYNGWPILTAENCFSKIRESGIVPWIEDPQYGFVEEYFEGAPSQEAFIKRMNNFNKFAPKTTVSRYKKPNGSKEIDGFKTTFTPYAMVFALIDDYVPVTAEWKHGNGLITIVPPAGAPTLDELRFNTLTGAMRFAAMREWKEETGTYPEMIVEIIEREGNAYRGGAGGLKVGNNIWKVEKYLTPELEEELRKHIREVAEEISSYYQVFLKLNEI